MQHSDGISWHLSFDNSSGGCDPFFLCSVRAALSSSFKGTFTAMDMRIFNYLQLDHTVCEIISDISNVHFIYMHNEATYYWKSRCEEMNLLVVASIRLSDLSVEFWLHFAVLKTDRYSQVNWHVVGSPLVLLILLSDRYKHMHDLVYVV